MTDRGRLERDRCRVDADRREIATRVMRGDEPRELAAVRQDDRGSLGPRDVRVRDDEPIRGPDDPRSGAGSARMHFDRAPPKYRRQLGKVTPERLAGHRPLRDPRASFVCGRSPTMIDTVFGSPPRMMRVASAFPIWSPPRTPNTSLGSVTGLSSTAMSTSPIKMPALSPGPPGSALTT